MRRSCFVFWLLMVGLLACSTVAGADSLCGGSAPSAPLSTGTKNVTLCGVMEKIGCDANNQTPAFLGIPYAEADRWQSPAPYVLPSSSPQTLPVQSYGAICPQDRTGACTTRSQCGGAPQPIPMSEDCLFLNVWTPPGAKSGDNLPVMVWIHGGAFLEGSSSSPDSSCNGNIFNGGFLAKTNQIIVVSFNYRLGALGFMVPQDGDGTYLAGGNYGLQDQQLAIKWVIDHIAGFGGDPSKIVLAGESAGAMSVGAHLTGATDLTNVKGGILESDPLGIPFKVQGEIGGPYYESFLAFFKSQKVCKDTDTDDQCFQKVQNLPKSDEVQTQILSAQGYAVAQVGAWMKVTKNAANYVHRALELFLPWSPVVGGNVFNLANGSITTQPLAGQPIALAASVNKPILLGTNKNEGLLFTDLGQTTITSADQLKGLAKGIFGINWLGYPSAEAKKVLKNYPPTDSSKNYTDPAIQILADYGFTCANQYFAQQVAAAGQPVWAYQFNEKSAFYPGRGSSLECCSQSQSCNQTYCALGGQTCGKTNAYCCLGTACHAAELPYVFADTSLFDGWTGDQKTMAANIATYWGTFVTNPQGGPNQSPLPKWQPFTGATVSNYLLMNTDQAGFFVTGDLEKSMADAPAIDCSLFTPCYGSGFPDCSSN